MIIQDRHRKDKISQLANTQIGEIVLKGMTKEEIANLEPEDIMTRQVEALEKEIKGLGAMKAMLLLNEVKLLMK